MLKPSRFNFIVPFNDNLYLLYNGITGAIFEITLQEKDDILEIFKSGKISDELYPRETIVRLLYGGALVPIGVDEVKILVDRAEKECMNHRTLDLTVAPTYSCNFRCVYCDNEFPPGKMSEEIEQRVSRFVSKVIRDYDCLNLSWYGGEPLLCLKTVIGLTEEIRDICSKHGKDMNGFVATNAFLLDREAIAKLVEAGVRHFHITIDGLEQFHDKLRVLNGGGPTFRRILDNLIFLLNNEPSAKVTLRMNLNENNIDSAKDLMDYIPSPHRQRVKLSLAPIIRDGYKPDPAFLNAINLIIRQGLRMGFRHQDSTVSAGYATPCHADKRGNFQITPDGKLFKCTPSHDNPEAGVGVISEDGTPVFNANHIIWNETPMLGDGCSECRFLCFCRGGCHIVRLRKSNNAFCKTRFEDVDNMIINKYLSLTGICQ